MKQIFLLSIAVLYTAFNVEAKKIQVRGQIIFPEDTLNVVLNISIRFDNYEPKFIKLQKGITYIDASGRVKKIKPAQAKEIRFSYRSKEYRMLSINNPIVEGDFFIENYAFYWLNMDGSLKLFTFYYYENEHINSYRLLQRRDDKLMRVYGIGFRYDIKMYLSDCPYLVQKLENKEFRVRDLEEIVQFYNDNCGN